MGRYAYGLCLRTGPPFGAQDLGFQFKMTVMGKVEASSVGVLIRNRWPSGDAVY